MNSAFIFETAKIVGSPTSDCWSQIHTFSPQDQEKKEKRGDLLAIFVITGLNKEIESIALGREVLGRLHEEYYGNLQENAFNRLSLSVKKISDEYNNLDLLVASVLRDVIYFSILGKGKVLLKREDKIGLVLQGDGGLKTASGKICDNDFFIMGSESFFNATGVGVLREALENGCLSESEEMLAPIILGKEEMSDAVSILVIFRKTEEDFSINTINSDEEDLFIPQPVIEERLPIKKNIFSKIKLPKFHPRIFIRGSGENKKKIYFAAALILLIFFALSVFFGINKNRYGNNKKEIIRPFEKTSEVKLQKQTIFPSIDIGDVKGELITSFQDKIIVSDSSGNKFYWVDIDKKSFGELGFSLTGTWFFYSYDNILYILSDQGISTLNSISNMPETKIQKDPDWKDIKELAVFNGNIYILDVGEKNIWRYLSIPSGYGLKSKWFSGENQLLSQAISFSIDSSVWILQKDGILKYTSGKKIDFNITGMTDMFIDPVKIYTTKAENSLYVFDQANKKIYEINKDGKFHASYDLNGIDNISDFTIDDNGKKIYLLSLGKIYSVDLKE